MYEVYKGAEIIVDYEAQSNKSIYEYFNNSSNFEGFTRLNSIDLEGEYFTIEDFPGEPIPLEYLIIFNHGTNEHENFDLMNM